MKISSKSLLLAAGLCLSAHAMDSGIEEAQAASRGFFSWAKDGLADWGIGERGVGYWWRKGLRTTKKEVTSLQDRYHRGTLKWDDPDMLVIEGIAAVFALYIGHKIYRKATQSKSKVTFEVETS